MSKDLTLMFVDDDDDVIKLVEEYAKLDIHKNTVFMIKLGGYAALNYLKRWDYQVDAIVLDLKMPDIGGLKLTQKIRENEKQYRIGQPPIKIFWYTGRKFNATDKYDPHTVVMREHDVDRVFVKPYPATDVVDEVVKRLRNGR